MSEQLRKYIEEARGHDVADDKIRDNLLNAGWPQFEIERTFDELDHPGGQTQVIRGPDSTDANASMGPQPAQTVQSKSGTFKVALIVLIVLAVLIIGGYFAYAKVINSPERVLKQANLNKVFGARAAYHGRETIKVSGKDLNGRKFKGEFHSNSELDLTGKDKLSNNKFSVGFGYQGLNFSVQDVELRMVGKTVYVNVSQIPYIGDYAKDYDGWIRMEGPDTESFNADLENLIKSIEQVKFVKSHQFVAKEKINNVAAYHYKLTIDKGALSKVLNSALESSLKNFGKGAEQINEEQIKQVREMLNKIVERINVKNVDVWIGLRDKQLHQVSMNAEYNDPETLKNFASGPIQISFVGAYSHFNEKIKVVAPPKSLDMSKDLKDLDSKMNPSLPSQSGVR